MTETKSLDIEVIQQCVSTIAHDELWAKSLAEEALGMARGHLECREDVAGTTAGSPT